MIIFEPVGIGISEKRIVTAQFHHLLDDAVSINSATVEIVGDPVGIIAGAPTINIKDVSFMLTISDTATAGTYRIIVTAIASDGQEVQCRDEDNNPIRIIVA